MRVRILHPAPTNKKVESMSYDDYEDFNNALAYEEELRIENDYRDAMAITHYLEEQEAQAEYDRRKKNAD